MAEEKPTIESSSSKIRASKNVTVAFKLNGGNYPLWSRLMKVAIGSRGGYSHITGKPAPPLPGSEEYEDWEETDLIVFSWIVDNIETDIIADFAHHQTSQALWESLAVTYESEADLYLVYDLEDKANTIRQGDMDLETYYRKIQGMWINIDRCQRQPIDCCDKGVSQFRVYSNTKRVLRFLAGLNREYEGVRRDILKEVSPPPIETAYSWVKKEAARRRIGAPSSSNTTTEGSHGSIDSGSGGIGHGLAAQRQRPPHRNGNSRPTTTAHRPGSKPADKSKLWCSHCGMQKHTRETCFQLVGYPDWWEERQTAKARMAVGFTVGNETAKPNPDDREGLNGRGKQKEAGPEASGGGGGGGVVGAGNFAEKAIWNGGRGGADNGGKGLGVHNPNPRCFSKFQRAPHYFRKLHKIPHALLKDPSIYDDLHATPQFMNYCEKPPDISRTVQISPVELQNRFEPLNQISAAYLVKNRIEGEKKGWIFDCGATDTMSPNKDDFISFSNITKTYIQTASGELITVAGTGTIEISPTLRLSNCLYVPTLSQRLMSISHVTKELNCTLLMHPNFCILQDIRTRRILGRGTESQGLYYVDEIAQQGSVMLAHGSTKREIWLWHQRLGHPSPGYFSLLFPKFSIPKDFACETCVLAKSHRQSFKPTNTRMNSIFSLVHADVWGPAPVIGGNGFRYFVIFVDDCTRMTWIYFLKHKSEVLDKFILFFKLVQTQFQTTIKTLRSDNGREFVNQKMTDFFTEKGLIHQTSCPYTPEQNGVAERKNRTILEITRALMIESKVPKSFWPEAVATSIFLINRLPTKILNKKTPLDILTKLTKIPEHLNLQPRVFGCTVYVHIPKHERTKLSPCATKCVFVGYGVNQKGYRCYDPSTQKVVTTMNCNFLETEFFYQTNFNSQGESESDKTFDYLSWFVPRSNLSDEDSTEKVSTATEQVSTTESSQPPPPNDPPQPVSEAPEVILNPPQENILPNPVDSDTALDETTGRYILPPRSTRGVPPKRYSPEKIGRMSQYAVANYTTAHLTKMARAFEAALYEEEEIPYTAEKAWQKKQWRDAMLVEMDALLKNKTWEVSQLPKGTATVGCRWVFTIKRRPDGSIDRYKARLVAKGYTQTYGVDYAETFSPVAKINTVRVLFSIAANREWPLHQFDVTNAFLHGELTKPVYMEPPPGFKREFLNGDVCKLKKTLYGLKQSPRAWFGRFTEVMKKYKYKQSNSDHTLFLKKRSGKITCLIIYVDDMIITGDDEEEIRQLKKNLFKEFEMKDLGALKYFLGIEVKRSKQGIFINQRKYVLDILAETGMIDCKPADTPIVQNHGLQIREGAKRTDRGKYQRLVGKLIYLSHTRPDLTYAVGVVSQFMHAPQEEHWEAVLRIVRYLKGTPGHGVLFKKHGHLEIHGYTDADWAGNPNDRKSTAGYFTFVGGNLVTWRSKKQKVVALSSAEAEFRGIKSGLTEVLWLRRLMTELELKSTQPCRLLCDNKAAISISENPVQHDRTKHVEVDRHFIKDTIDAKIVELPYVKSEDQLADILTKAVNSQFFHGVLDKLSIGNPVT